METEKRLKLTEYDYFYNAAAHFEAQEKYPDGLGAAMLAPGKVGFVALCWGLHLLMAHAENMRAYLGHEKRIIPSADELAARMTPKQLMVGRTLALEAIRKGLEMGDDSEEEDEVLAELEKKTGSA